MVRFLESRFLLLVLLLLAVMGTVMVLSALQEVQTWDEGFDLAAGYSYWKTGDFRINREHPPLGKYINALPLLVLNPALPLDHPSWREENPPAFGSQFLYHNRIPADTLMFAGRSMTILLTLCLGLALALWTRRQFGAPAALLALLLFVCDPNIIAHGRYVTSDFVVTLFIFLAVITWDAWLRSGRRRDLLWAGLTFGCAIMSKFSAFLLVPIHLLLYLIQWRVSRRAFSVWHFARSFITVGLLAFLVMLVMYAPEDGKLIPMSHHARLAHPELHTLRETINTGSLYGKAMAYLGTRLGLRDHSFFLATSHLAAHNAAGHSAYLLGKHSDNGWWYYFPVVFAVKTPTATLLAFVAALLLACRGFRARWLVMLVPAVVFFLFCMTAGINIGVRHILPVYPFVMVFSAAVLTGSSYRLKPWLVGAVAVILVAESAAIYPHYLAFFNTISGGPGHGPHYLLDSNIDWGQDVKKLKRWMDAHGVHQIRILYFGCADLWYYNIPNGTVPEADDEKGWAQLDEVVAANVTPLYGAYVGPERLARLRAMQPIAKIGYSIYLYDFRKPKPALPAPQSTGSRGSAGS